MRLLKIKRGSWFFICNVFYSSVNWFATIYVYICCVFMPLLYLTYIIIIHLTYTHIVYYTFQRWLVYVIYVSSVHTTATFIRNYLWQDPRWKSLMYDQRASDRNFNSFLPAVYPFLKMVLCADDSVGATSIFCWW